jgi:ABC-type nitrate/sulfonate/bicarbonate transport system substrate-binding protein
MGRKQMRARRRETAAMIVFIVCLSLAGSANAQLRKVNIAYTATSPYQAVLIVAKEVGLFKKHNLDPTLVFTTGGSLGIQAMIGGDVAMTLSDGSSSVLSKLAGVDVLVIASLLNTFPYSLISLPEIKKVDQLRGAKIAVSRFGSATDLSVKMALARVGLNAEKDVTLLQIGVQTARYAALLSKNVQATIITPPFTLTARKAGMQTLLDMAELNIPFQLTALLALRPYLKSNPDMVLSVIRTLSEAIHFYKREKEATIKILGKYLKTDDREALEETHREIAIKALPEKPYPTLAGIRTIVDETALRNPKAKGAKPEDFVDSSFVKKVDDEGLFERLYKR